jgi:hypothetical protein
MAVRGKTLPVATRFAVMVCVLWTSFNCTTVFMGTASLGRTETCHTAFVLLWTCPDTVAGTILCVLRPLDVIGGWFGGGVVVKGAYIVQTVGLNIISQRQCDVARCLR